MNRTQKIILWVGVLVMVGMCLFPHKVWHWTRKGGETISKPLGHSFLFSLPTYPDIIPMEATMSGFSKGIAKGRATSGFIFGFAHLDLSRLAIQCFILAILTGAGIVTAKKNKVG